MSIVNGLTVQKLTPPGYFNLSDTAPSIHKDYISWFQSQLTLSAEQSAAMTTLILSPWLVSFNDAPRAPWLNFLLNTYGMGFFGGTNNQAAFLYRLISGSWRTSTITNIKTILDTFCMPPFSWFDAALLPRVFSANLVASITDTGFLIYSTASSPSTPANTPYSSRAWTVPTGWTRAPSSAVKYCMGYLSGGNIVWCTPRPVADFTNATYFSAGIPGAVPSAGTVCIVDTDGTGDRRSIYYSDGTAWRKNSLSNVNLGLVPGGGSRPTPEAVTVFAPNPATVVYAIDSAFPPPASGATQGYGTFAGWAGTSISGNSLEIRLAQIAGGSIAIATVLALLRRVKPISYVVKVTIDSTVYTVSDARAAP